MKQPGAESALDVRTALSIALLCALPRLGLLFWQAPLQAPEGYYYWYLSESLLRHGVLGFDGAPSTAFAPGYPAFLALFRWLSGDNVIWMMGAQIGVAVVGALYLFKLCLTLTASAAVAWVAAFLYAIYPYYVRQSIGIIEVTPYTTLLIACAYYYSRAADTFGWARSGVAFGLTLLVRAAALPIAGLGVLVLLRRRRFLAAAVVCGCALLVTLPLLARNHAIDGSLMFSRSGENLVAGNCEYSDQLIPEFNLDLIGDCEPAGAVGWRDPAMSDEERNAYYTGRALAFAAEHPWRTLKLKLLNVVYFFHPRIVPFHALDEHTVFVPTDGGGFRVEGSAPRHALGEGLHAFVYGLIFLSALWGMWLRRRDTGRDAILYCIVLSFVFVGSVYFPTTRLRAPMDFVLMFFSAVAIARWLRRA